MRVILDGKKGRAVGFNLHDYRAVEYGYAATVHKTQGATVDRVFVLATPGMDRHLAYVGMTRLRRSSPRAQEKDPTLDYAERGFEHAADAQRRQQERVLVPEQRTPAVAKARARSHRALQGGAAGVIGVAGRFDLDPAAKARADDLREEMKSAAQEIAKHPDRMRGAERTGIGGQVKSLIRQAERERGREKGKGLDRDEGLER